MALMKSLDSGISGLRAFQTKMDVIGNNIANVETNGFKSSLVLLFFMHLYYDNKINLILILSSVLFLALFIGLTMIDVNRRQDLYDIKGKLVKPQVEYKSNNHSSGH